MTPNEVEQDIQRFEAALAGDSAAAAFPALAEAHRRAGRPQEAERVARGGLERRPDALAGRVALGLALLDLERIDEARAELERVLSSVPDHPLALAGLEASDVSPSAPSPQAPFADDLDGGEIDAAFADARPEEDQMVSADSVAASAIRAAELGDPEGFSDEETDIPIATGDYDPVVATLERWLDNLRRTAP